VTNEEWAPPGIDTKKPSIARVYDFMLGGKDNFAIDRQVGELALQITPDGPEAARANRAFLRRVIRYLTAEAGIRQFLDIGSGLPSQGNVHEIAQAVDPTARVVYVDSDPIVLAHGRALLGSNDTTKVIQADLRQPEDILDHPDVHALIDFKQPVGLLLFAILHHLKDSEDPGGVAARLRDALPSGSYVAISHFHNPGDAHPDASKKAVVVEKIFNETLGTGRWRTHDEILGYFGDFEVLEPGLVPLAEWRPEQGETFEQPDTHYTFVGGLARKP
jgi:S-adenosyl methyltransferase